MSKSKVYLCNAVVAEFLNIRTGVLLYAIGNVYESQELLEKSFDYHQRALAQVRATVGEHHRSTGDIAYKVGCHMIRLRRYSEAQSVFFHAYSLK